MPFHGLWLSVKIRVEPEVQTFQNVPDHNILHNSHKVSVVQNENNVILMYECYDTCVVYQQSQHEWLSKWIIVEQMRK